MALLLVLASLPGQLAASTLEYSVKGVDGELRKNIIAWLGVEPATAAERSLFIASAKDRTRSSLKALGYYSPSIQLLVNRESSPWEMTVAVTANAPILIDNIDIQVQGEAADDAQFKRLLGELPFAPGDVLHHGVYEKFKKQLIALGQQRGFFDAVTDRSQVGVNVNDASANIVLQYSSGRRYRFGEMRVEQSIMDMSWVDSVIRFKPGEMFDLSLLQQLRSELQQTRYFSTVIVRPLLDELADGHVPVSVKLSAVDRHSFEFGVGYSSDTQERVSVTWRTPLVNRHGHSQETRLEYSAVNPSGRFTYNIPLGHPLYDVLQLSVYLEDNEYGDLDSKQKGARVRREIKRGNWIGSYSVRSLDESWEVANVHLDNDYILPGATLSHKSRSGSLVDPLAGLHQLYQIEGGHEDLGSDINLFRAMGSFRLVAPLARDHRLVARAELGAVFHSQGDRKDLAPSLTFFAGGSQSLRGFSYQSIGNEVFVAGADSDSATSTVGGDRLLIGSLEYQYYFTDTWRGAVFVDGGDAFDEGDFDLHVGAGFGVHYLSPVGAIRLELANDVSEDNPSWRLHINIGAEF